MGGWQQRLVSFPSSFSSYAIRLCKGTVVGSYTNSCVCVLPSALVVRPLFLIPPLSLFRLYIFFVCDGGKRERPGSLINRQAPLLVGANNSLPLFFFFHKREEKASKTLRLFFPFSFFFSGGENDTSFHRDVMAAAVFNHDDGSEPVSTRTDTKDGPRVPPPMG